MEIVSAAASLPPSTSSSSSSPLPAAAAAGKREMGEFRPGSEAGGDSNWSADVRGDDEDNNCKAEEGE